MSGCWTDKPTPSRGPVLQGGCCRLLTAFFALALTVFAQAPLSASDAFSNPFQYFTRSTPLGLNTTPHPAVVRVQVQEANAQASGSGSLVAARDHYGLVVTNWHVVRDAAGKIDVVFPDGYRSAATVLKTDQDWDLAALLIWRPNHVSPLAISETAPQPGDTLAIAGYGAGDYRSVTGKCTQYVSPSPHHPYEIVELSAQARQGDSGGPIFNERKELAGVLFGASRGSTSGSYCGRVRAFLTSVWPDLDHPRPTTTVETPLVGFNPSNSASNEVYRSETTLVPVQDRVVPDPVSIPTSTPPPAAPVNWSPSPSPQAVVENASERPRESPHPSLVENDRSWEFPEISHSPLPPLDPSRPSGPNWEELLGKTRFDQAKSVLAIIGMLAVWGHLARWISR